MPELASFDVFDTCLTRSYAVPSDLFADLADRLRERLTPLFGDRYQQAFVAARIQAEETAREKSAFEEVTITEIWQELCARLPQLDPATGVARELNLEEEAARVIESCVELVKTARLSGARVAFISDTYLPGALIWRLLLDHGIAQAGDALYVSSERRLTKRTGRLFHAVLQLEHLRPHDIVHTGDNPQSDFAVPRAMGLRTRLTKECGFLPTEAAIASLRVADHPVASRLGGEMRAFRLQATGSARTGFHDFVGSFLGPYLVTFASWILARAEEDGVRRLYFVSRDGYLLREVAAHLSPLFGAIDCRYLYTSRQSLFLPTVHAVTPEAMPWLWRGFEAPSVKRLLAKLELESEVDAVLEALGAPSPADMYLGSGDEWQAFWQLLRSDSYRRRILEIAETRRSATLDYLHGAGLLEDVPWALVDIGWTLSCQKALGDLLRLRGRANLPAGYYLGLSLSRVLESAAGPARAMFYEFPSDRATLFAAAAAFRRVELLEPLLGAAPHGTVHHYEAKAGVCVPVTGAISESAVRTSQALAACATEFTRLAGPLGVALGGKEISPLILETLADVAFRSPERGWVAAVADIQASEDQNGLGARPLVAPLTWKDAIAGASPRLVRGILRWERPRGVWREGDYCLSGWAVRGAASASAWAWQTLRTCLRRPTHPGW